MKFLPYERLVVYANAPIEAVQDRLKSLVAAKSLGLEKRNSWQPVLVGDLVQVPGGTEVRVQMRLHAYVAVFMVLWLGGLLVAAALKLGQAFGFASGAARGKASSGGGLEFAMVGVMALAGYAMMTFGFWTGAGENRAFLRERLGCTETKA